jgi:arylsulfatase A-like enzyme/tetratricopeptide (TPR) repeat protein
MRRGALLAAGAGVATASALLTLPILRPAWREHRLQAVPRPLDVVLITMDTTRADKLGAFGGDRGTTPVLDELARRGVVFERAYSHVPLTLPSHASLMTGLTPARTGVHDNITFVLDAAPPTLAEILAGRGYRTGAFLSTLILERRYGLGRGFEEYEDRMDGEDGDGVLPERRGDETVDRALAWVETDRTRPLFLWVHLYDPHAPYTPPEPFASRFKGRRYDGELAFMDFQIGRLLAGIARRERPTLVAALADHGESLGEHREPTHGFFVYDATQRVPLILSLPGHLPSNVSVAPLVRMVDVMPTLLEIAGLPAPGGLDGRSLVPLMTGRTTVSPGPAYLEAYSSRFWWGARELLGVRTGPWLFIQAPQPEIYNVVEDPAESVNLASARPAELEMLGSQLKALAPKGDVFAQRTSVDDETVERLQALGYVAAVTQGTAGSEDDLPDPKEYAPLLTKAAEAYALAGQRDYARALEKFQEILQAAPRVVAARRETGKMLLALQRYEEAYETFRQLRDEYPSEQAYHIDVARARFKQGKKREALELLQASLLAFPASVGLLENAGIVLASLGRNREAEDALRRAIEAGPEERKPRMLLAKMCDTQGRVEEAAAQFQELVERSPHARESREAAKRLAAMAVEFARAGKLESSARAYGAALKTGAGMEEGVFLNAALVYYRLGRRGDAQDVLRKGARSFPASADIRYRLGRLLSEAGPPGPAEAEYRQALALAPTRSDVRFHLARLLETSGRAAEATESYRQVANDPGSREASRARQALERLGSDK